MGDSAHESYVGCYFKQKLKLKRDREICNCALVKNAERYIPTGHATN